MNYKTAGNFQNDFGNKRTITSEQYYQFGWARIGYMMYPLARACRLRDMQLARQILHDLRQEWEGQDALLKSSGIENITHHHLKVNCLRTLTLLISEKMTGRITSQRYQHIFSEIKRIEKMLDTMMNQTEGIRKIGDGINVVI